MAGFDWLDMAWVYMVLEKKGVDRRVIDRVQRLYSWNNSIVVVNNQLGKKIPTTGAP